jgi:hypothetical protein
MLGLQHTNIEHTLKELEGKIKLESETYDTTMKELNAILQKVVPEDSTFQERNYV